MMKSNFLDKTASIIIRAFPYPARPLPGEKIRRHVDELVHKKDLFLESSNKYGTPQYFYDETSVESALENFTGTFNKYLKRFRVFYAMKSNHLSSLCDRAVKSGAGLDVSSGMELKSAISLKCKNIIFSGPGKTNEELALAVANSEIVTLMMDSPGEYRRLADVIRKSGSQNRKMSAGIRIKNTRKKTWNKFGVPLDELGYFLKTVDEDKLIEAAGIQFHTSWNLGPDAQVKLIEDIGKYLKNRIPRNYTENFRFIDIGGGYWPDSGEWLNPENTLAGKLFRNLFPNMRFDENHYYIKSFGLETFAREIADSISAQGAPLNRLELWTEPGRWISTKSIHILLKVVDVKKTGEVITDGGINIIGWERPLTEYIPLVNLTRPSVREKSITVFGSLCTPDDLWGRTLFGRDIKIGDILIVPDQGAYTYSLRQAFIKPVPRVIRYDGKFLEMIKDDNEILSL